MKLYVYKLLEQGEQNLSSETRLNFINDIKSNEKIKMTERAKVEYEKVEGTTEESEKYIIFHFIKSKEINTKNFRKKEDKVNPISEEDEENLKDEYIEASDVFIIIVDDIVYISYLFKDFSQVKGFFQKLSKTFETEKLILKNQFKRAFIENAVVDKYTIKNLTKEKQVSLGLFLNNPSKTLGDEYDSSRIDLVIHNPKEIRKIIEQLREDDNMTDRTVEYYLEGQIDDEKFVYDKKKAFKYIDIPVDMKNDINIIINNIKLKLGIE